MKWKNNAYSVLASGITNVATTITVSAGTGSRFPSDDFLVTLIGYDVNGNENAWEICYCSSRSSDTLTVVRAQEGTTAVAWAGATRIEGRVTAGAVGALEPSIAAGTTSQYWRGDKSWRDFFTDVRATALTGLSTATNAVITAADTVLGALGKLQKQVSDNLSTLTSHTGNTSNPHGTTAAQVGAFPSAGGSLAGDVTFTGNGRRIKGLLSTATALADRLFFQSDTANGSTDVAAVPNGTSNRAGFGALNSSDTTNHSFFSFLALVSDMRLWSGKAGTGTVLPMTFYTDNSERMRIGANGHIQAAQSIGFTSQFNAGNSGTSITIDFINGQKQLLTLTGNATVTLAFPGVGNYQLILTQDATGSRTVSWSGVTRYVGSATAPAINTAASTSTVVSIYYDGTNVWLGASKVNA